MPLASKMVQAAFCYLVNCRNRRREHQSQSLLRAGTHTRKWTFRQDRHIRSNSRRNAQKYPFARRSLNSEDWTPRHINDSIIALVCKIEDGCGSSDGKDRIYLTQFNFQRNLGFYHAFIAKNHHSMYRNQINDDKRYNKNRHCCVFTKSSVLIAEED